MRLCIYNYYIASINLYVLHFAIGTIYTIVVLSNHLTTVPVAYERA